MIFLCIEVCIFLESVVKMGYDVTRFDGQVDEELLCPICSFVLEDPLQVSDMLEQVI